jgi:hypothetical protein
MRLLKREAASGVSVHSGDTGDMIHIAWSSCFEVSDEVALPLGRARVHDRLARDMIVT